jgi:hypothetical protein
MRCAVEAIRPRGLGSLAMDAGSPCFRKTAPIDADEGVDGMSFTLTKGIHVNFKWRTITGSNQEDWPFRQGKQISPSLLAQIIGAKVYRFYFHAGVGTVACYIGESERFERRVREYIRALSLMRLSGSLADSTVERLENAIKNLHRHSKVRVAAGIVNAEIDGTMVELQLIDFEEFGFNRVVISPNTLSDPFHRKVIENLAILDASSSGIRLLNRGRDAAAKSFSRLLSKQGNVRNAPKK